jgi:hypothetical protein
MTPKADKKETLTEDEMARRKLGGVKGFVEGEPAPLTKPEDEQTPPNKSPATLRKDPEPLPTPM